MKNTLIAIIAIAILGFFAYAYSMKSGQSSEAMMEKKDEVSMGEKSSDAMMEKSDKAMMEKTDGEMMTESRYVEYSTNALEKASTGKTVLFFYASWCPTCQPTDANLRESSDQIPEGMTVIRVNYNDPDTDQEEKELAKKYGITYQHTFVQIDGQGKEITKWNGGKIEELLKNVK